MLLSSLHPLVVPHIVFHIQWMLSKCLLHSICCEKPYFILLVYHQPCQERAPIDYFKERSNKIRFIFRPMSFTS